MVALFVSLFFFVETRVIPVEQTLLAILKVAAFGWEKSCLLLEVEGRQVVEVLVVKEERKGRERELWRACGHMLT
jgi:hypothetical protein